MIKFKSILEELLKEAPVGTDPFDPQKSMLQITTAVTQYIDAALNMLHSDTLVGTDSTASAFESVIVGLEQAKQAIDPLHQQNVNNYNSVMQRQPNPPGLPQDPLAVDDTLGDFR